MGSNINKQKLVSSTRKNLSGLKNLLMGLAAGKSDKALIEEALRFTKYIEETSWLAGFESVTEISGEMETLFDLIGKDHLGVTPELAETCLNAVDYIEDLLSEGHIKNPGDIFSHEELKVSFERLMSPSLLASGMTGRDNRKVQLPDNRKSTWHIILNLNNEIVPDSVNLVYIFHNLFLLGEYKIYKQSSENDENQYWSIFLSTYKGFNDIESTLYSIKGSCRIFKIADYDIFNDEAADYKGNNDNGGSNYLTAGTPDKSSTNGEERHGTKPFYLFRQVKINPSTAIDKTLNMSMIRSNHQSYSVN